MKNKSIIIAGQSVDPGSRATITLPSADLYTQSKINLPIHVFHGKHSGPKCFITSVIHGDEINSVEILRRLHSHAVLKKIRGTLITIPVVNVYGFILQSRYLPDRRDLNRSFPGSKIGSLAARLANLLMSEVITQCQYGIDLHTGASGRINMPQLRVNLSVPGAREMAFAFDVPVILDAKVRDGSLRGAASELGIPLLVYEGGEALRYNEISIRAGVRGILKVMAKLGMIPVNPDEGKKRRFKPIIAQASRWVRAVTSGLVQPIAELAEPVKEGEQIALIHDPFLINSTQKVVAPFDGIVIGRSNLPLVNEGDAIYNIASVKKLKDVTACIEELKDEIAHE